MTFVTSEAVEEVWLFHLALADEWSEGLDAGVYERSTIGVSLAEQGFIHCSYEHQVQVIADILYRGRTDVVLLRIDRERVEAEVRVESLDGGTDLFPHIYGPLPTAAVVRYDDVPTDAEGRLMVQALLGDA